MTRAMKHGLISQEKKNHREARESYGELAESNGKFGFALNLSTTLCDHRSLSQFLFPCRRMNVIGGLNRVG